MFDVKCLAGTVGSVIGHDGVVEGGTGELRRTRSRKLNRCMKISRDNPAAGGTGVMGESGKIKIGKRVLGNTGIELSELGFGCASVWGKKYISDDEATDLFEKAYELGIRYFDTGYSYGIAEKRIGEVLKKSDLVKRDEIIISSKFGTKRVNGKYVHDWSPGWMKHSVETSLRRMGTDHLDLLMCHGPQIRDLTDEFLAAVRALKKRGITRAIGINTFDTDVIEHVRDTRCFDFVMLDYNIMRQDREKLISGLGKEGIGVIAGAPLAESLYSNRVFKIRNRKDIWYLARALVHHRDKLAQKNRYGFLHNVPGATGTQLALKYVLDNPDISSAVFGTTTMSHLKENVKAVRVNIPYEIKMQIKRQGNG